MKESVIDLRAEARRLVAKYPQRKERSALIPLLWLAQQRDGYVTARAIDEIAEILGLSSADVRGVASFYHMLKLKPKGRYVVSVCHTLACELAGAEKVIAALESDLQITCGETTDDGAITLERAECLAACDLAPLLQFDYDEVRGRMTPESAVATVRAVAADLEYRSGDPHLVARAVTESPLVDSIPLSSDEEDLLHPEQKRGHRLPPASERLGELADAQLADEEAGDETQSIRPRGAEE